MIFLHLINKHSLITSAGYLEEPRKFVGDRVSARLVCYGKQVVSWKGLLPCLGIVAAWIRTRVQFQSLRVAESKSGHKSEIAESESVEMRPSAVGQAIGGVGGVVSCVMAGRSAVLLRSPWPCRPVMALFP